MLVYAGGGGPTLGYIQGQSRRDSMQSVQKGLYALLFAVGVSVHCRGVGLDGL